MSDSGIFLIQDGKPVVLKQRPFDSEDLLQEALASYPEVLAGGTTASADQPRRLLLVRREMGVPKAESLVEWWSLDHLFIDDQGVPVVVEVKRSSDTRIRREVVGQMLDYAANGVKYWPVEKLRGHVEQRAQELASAGGENASADSAALLKSELDVDDEEQFWSTVNANLQAGRIRMVFVADALPPELIRIIEFLNEQMNPAEVLGVEVPQYLQDDVAPGAKPLQILVPRMVGRTAAAVAAKESSSHGPWSEDTMLEVAGGVSEELAARFQRLFAHVDKHLGRINWGRGINPGYSGCYPVGDEIVAVYSANAGGVSEGAVGYIYFWFPELKQRLEPARFDALVAKLREIPGYRPKIDKAAAVGFEKKYPSVGVRDLIPQDEQRIFDAIEIVVGDRPVFQAAGD